MVLSLIIMLNLDKMIKMFIVNKNLEFFSKNCYSDVTFNSTAISSS